MESAQRHQLAHRAQMERPSGSRRTARLWEGPAGLMSPPAGAGRTALPPSSGLLPLLLRANHASARPELPTPVGSGGAPTSLMTC